MSMLRWPWRRQGRGNEPNVARRAGSPGSPSVTDLVARLDDWLRTNRPDYYSLLLPGLNDDEIGRMELAMSVVLPDDIRQLYRWRNGTDTEASFETIEYNRAWLCAEQVVAEWDFLSHELEEYLYAIEDWWHPVWAPFLQGAGGDYYCVDTAGTMGGPVGQIVDYNHEVGVRIVPFPSVTKWLEALVVGLEHGLRTYDEDFGLHDDSDERLDALVAGLNPGYPVTHHADRWSDE